MRFVKASEFTPVPLKTYFAQWTLGKPFKCSGYFDNIGIFRWDADGYAPIQNVERERQHLLILDETEQSPDDAKIKPLIEALEKIKNYSTHPQTRQMNEIWKICDQALKNYNP